MGSTLMINLLAVGSLGSPPYTWGAQRPPGLGGPSGRITPIYMGSTVLPNLSNPVLRDHPHIHGEHMIITILTARAIGSPPYTWGALTDSESNYLAGGITPIYMGSTLPDYNAG